MPWWPHVRISVQGLSFKSLLFRFCCVLLLTRGRPCAAYPMHHHASALAGKPAVAMARSSVGGGFDVILGSKSRTRRSILGEMGFNKITCVPANIDEKAIGDRLKDAPRDLVLAIARAKMDALVSEIPQHMAGHTRAVVLTGDQVVVHESRILEKPTCASEALEFIAGYSRSPCRTVGSAVILDPASGKRVEGVDSATIHFKPIPAAVAQELVDEGEVLHCAGGLMIEHPLVQPYIERIEGTIDSVMGLSKLLVERLLAELELGKEQGANSDCGGGPS